MSEAATAFHRHARVVLEHELHRARAPLRALPDERRRVVEDLAADVATAGLLDAARVEPALAAALASIYASDPVGSRKPCCDSD
jgi:hypothetical protein